MFILTHVLISESSISGSIWCFWQSTFSIGGHTDAMFPPSSNFQNLFPLKKSDFVGFPVLRTISRKMSFPKFSDNYRCFQRIKIFLSKFLEWKRALNSKLQTCTFEFQHKNRIWTLIQSFQLRWLKIKGIHAAFPSLITLLSHHLK